MEPDQQIAFDGIDRLFRPDKGEAAVGAEDGQQQGSVDPQGGRHVAIKGSTMALLYEANLDLVEDAGAEPER